MNKIILFKINCVVVSIFILGLTFLSVNCYSLTTISSNGVSIEQRLVEQVITINAKNQPIKSILYEIQKQSGISFAFTEGEYADELSNLTLQVKNISVGETLNQLLENTNYTYKVAGNSVTIVKRPAQQEQKKFSLKGKVIAASTKRPIVGATVLIIGTANGAITDDKGNFGITVAVGQSIEVSFVGMKQVIKKIESEIKELNITLEEDQMNIDNVVVTGYGNISKNSFTGNATTIKGDDLMKVSRTNVLKALQAFDPSLRLGDNIRFGSDPNALPEMYIRGSSSLGTMGLDKDKLSKNSLEKNPNTPTFIMDGFEVSLQKVYDLDPNRIQTMTILKDAAATAMYGSRAANGVIVITTIPPKEGEVRVSYNLTTTLEFPDLSDYSLMNAREKFETERLSGLFEPRPDMPNSHYRDYVDKYNTIFIEGVDTDWMSLPLRNAFKHKHSASIEGGTSSIRYMFNASYDGDNGVMKGSNRNTGGLDFNIHMTFGKMTLRNIVSFSNTTSTESPYGSFGDFSHKQPYSKYKDDNGLYLKTLDYSNSRPNPMREAQLKNFTKNKLNEIMDNLQIRWNFNDYLFAEGQFSIMQNWEDNNRFVDPQSLNSSIKLDTNNLLAGDLYTNVGGSGRINGKFLLSYNRAIDKHNMNFSLNAEMSESTGNNVSTHYRGFPSGSLSSINYASEVNGKPQKAERKARTAGVSGVFNYSYNNIYLADLSLRYEGSSAFGSKEKAAPYWAAGLGVNIHNYEFMKNVEWLDFLKLRASYGQTGNVNFPAYAAQSYYDTMFDDWYITGYGTKIKYLGNSDLKAETTNTFDIGFDLTMVNDRLNLKASYYNKTTVDMINDVTIPTSSGFSTYKDNLGKVRNVGFEAFVTGVVVQKKDFNLSLNFNFAQNTNKMVEIAQSLKDYNNRVNDYYGADTDYGAPKGDQNVIWTKYEEGNSMTALYGMRSLGIDPATGQEVFLNRAGGVVYDWNAKEMVNIGDTEPRGQGGFGLNARYKNLTLTATLQYEFGGDYYNSTLINYVENAKIETENVDKRVLTDRWQKPGDIAPLKDIKDTSGETKPTSRFMQKNNYLSLNSISLQYEFGESVTKALHIERIRLEANCSEVFRFCTIKQERGLDYPFARSYGLTLMVNF